MEVYLREKKSAIIADRRCSVPLADDQKSNILLVQEKYANVINDAEARSRISAARSIVSMGAQRSKLPDIDGKADNVSMASPKQLHDRMLRDFPNKEMGPLYE